MPSQEYIEITPDKLMNLHDALEMLEMLNREAIRELDICVYGITDNPSIIDAAKEAIADAAEFEIREEDVKLTEVAVAIPLSSDILYKLSGSGIRLKNEEFVYTGENEGPRRLSFTFADFKPTVALNQFSQIAIASSDSYLPDFMGQYGNKQPAQIEKQVRRTEEATQPGVPPPTTPPTDPAAPTTPAVPPTPGVPKQTSLKISDLLESFLG